MTSLGFLFNIACIINSLPLNVGNVLLPGLRRTEKIICAIAADIPIVSEAYIKACQTATRLPSPTRYRIDAVSTFII